MPALYPPEYPDRPDAPLLSFGPSFSEEIASSVLRATFHENDEQPQESEVRAAASLTMLEGFHPRDHLECMMAAQGVALHCAEMDSLASAARPGQSDAMVIKWRANAALMSRSFLATARELDRRRQSKPLPPRPRDPSPDPPPDAPPDPPPIRPARDTPSPAGRENADPAEDSATGTKPPRARAGAKTAPPPAADEAATAPHAPFPDLADPPEAPEEIETRPDGTPGSLTAYAPKPPVQVYIPRIAPVMLALNTRPGPYQLVNDPAGQIDRATGLPRSPSTEEPPPGEPPPGETPPGETTSGEAPPRGVPRGPLDVTERIFSGDSLSRFASARFDPDAPPPPLFEHEDSVVELELISTGGDPEFEAHRAAMIAAHPEGKPIVVFRHGTFPPPADGDDTRSMDRPMDRICKAPPDT
jgi:hypothetical protein